MFELINIPEAIIPADACITDAMRAIDASGCHMALVIDENGLLKGIVTDGDVRRGLLEGCAQTDAISSILQTKPKTIDVNMANDDALAAFKAKGVETMPVVDEHGAPAGMLTLRNLVQVDGTLAPKFSRAVIMAGGEGQRLRPFTETTPKPLIDVGGRPLIDRIIERLSRSGISDIYVSVNYLAEKIKAHLGDGSVYDTQISYIEEVKKLGTAGALSLMDTSNLDGPVLVINGDILTNSDFDRMRAFHRSMDSALTLAVSEYRLQVPYGVIELENGLICGLKEKPEQTVHINAGIYLLEPRIIETIPKDQYFDMTNLIESCLAAKERVSPFLIHEQWIDIGNATDLARARSRAEMFENE